MQHEVPWIKQKTILRPQCRLHSKIISLLNDAETMLVIHEYIQNAGESIYPQIYI